MEPEESAPAPASERTEAADVAAFMSSREAAGEESEDDAAEVAEALRLASVERTKRRAEEKKSSAEVASFVRRAEEAMADGAFMDAVKHYTDGLAVEPQNVKLLSERGKLCARLNLHKATLHDGEMIVRLMPDWAQGHALCGMALFCLRQYAPSVRAYRTALAYSAPDAAERGGLEEALEQARAKVGEELRLAVLKEDVAELQRLLFGGGKAPAGAEGGGGGGGGGGEPGGGSRPEPNSNSAVDLEAREPSHGFTALSLAVAAGKAESVRLLLEAGADPNARDKFGKTSLMWAASMGLERLATSLWRSGADLRARDATGWDALFSACHGGHLRLVTVWLQNAELDRATNDGTTCLMAAAQAGRAAVVKLLLSKKADATCANSKGQRALELALAGSHDETADLLRPLTPGQPPAAGSSAPAQKGGDGAGSGSGGGKGASGGQAAKGRLASTSLQTFVLAVTTILALIFALFM